MNIIDFFKLQAILTKNSSKLSQVIMYLFTVIDHH